MKANKFAQVIFMFLLSHDFFYHAPIFSSVITHISPAETNSQSTLSFYPFLEWEKEYESFVTEDWDNPFFEKLSLQLRKLSYHEIKTIENEAYILGFYDFYKPGSKRYGELSGAQKKTFEYIAFKIDQYLNYQKK